MRIAYIDHSHHRKTGSTRFFLDLLEELGTVDVYWDESWLGKRRVDVWEVLSRHYDVIVVFQMEVHAKFLKDKGRRRRVVFVPMYDSCLRYPESFWRELAEIEILCFCRTLFERLQGWGLRVRYAQYFPDPAQFTVNTRPDYAGFFWPRRQELPWGTIRSLLGDSKLSWINLHQAPDIQSSETTEISSTDRTHYRLRFSAWSEDRRGYHRAMRQAGVYFAPRLYEGIGMSFLEAMAMGKAVVAPDNPTMNEYLTHEVNGFLYKPEDPRPVNLKRFRELGKAARETIERGRPRWRQSREELGAWLLGATPGNGVYWRLRIHSG